MYATRSSASGWSPRSASTRTTSCRQVIALKKKGATARQGLRGDHQKGIDPISLDMLAKETSSACVARRREHGAPGPLAAAASAPTPRGVSPGDPRQAGKVYEHVLGEEKYTFVEEVARSSCTILLKGPNDHTLAQLKDAVRDGFARSQERRCRRAVVPGAGAFEAASRAPLGGDAQAVEGRRSAAWRRSRRRCWSSRRPRREQRVRRAGRVHRAGRKRRRRGTRWAGRHHGRAVRPHRRRVPTTSSSRRRSCTPRRVATLLLVDEVMRAGSTCARGEKDDERVFKKKTTGL